MLETLSIDLATHHYSIHLAEGLLSEIGNYLKPIAKNSKIALITDELVVTLYAQTIFQALEDEFEVNLYTIPVGEGSKSLTQVETLCESMSQDNHNRQSLIIALGGGVVGDLAGFIAAVFYRGIPVVQIPTTLVSQIDSSIGGKTGVNLATGKNLVGSFHQPSLVLIDPITLKTLPPREYNGGFAEIIKHAAIASPEMFAIIKSLNPGQQNLPINFLKENLRIKSAIVQADEKELLGKRVWLNFGHSLGHAIEASTPYGTQLHGEAISLGIRAALFLSEKICQLSNKESQLVLEALAQFQLPLVLSDDISDSALLEKLQKDKKNHSKKIHFILLESLGNPKTINVSNQDILEAIAHIRTTI